MTKKAFLNVNVTRSHESLLICLVEPELSSSLIVESYIGDAQRDSQESDGLFLHRNKDGF